MEIALTDCITISYVSPEVGAFHFVKHHADSADSKNAANGKNTADSADSKKRGRLFRQPLNSLTKLLDLDFIDLGFLQFA